VGADADMCLFDEDLNLLNVFGKGKMLMDEGKVLVKGSFES